MNSSLTRRALLGGTLAACVFPTGCAKVPTTSLGTTTQKLMRVHFAVRGTLTPINTTTGRQNFYFVVINLTNNANAPGPVPQLTPPFSNGIAVASLTDTTNNPENTGMVGFVQYGGTLSDVHLFRAPMDSTTQTWQLAQNTRYTEYTDLNQVESFTVGTSTLDFQVDLTRLLLPATSTTAAQTLPSYVQVNIITTDLVPSGSALDQPKLWDGMGDGRTVINTYVTLSTVQSGQIATSADGRTTDEPSDPDVRDRTYAGVVQNDSIDLTNWTIQIL